MLFFAVIKAVDGTLDRTCPVPVPYRTVQSKTAGHNAYLNRASVSALGLQDSRVHVYLAQPFQPGRSRVHINLVLSHQSSHML